MSALTPAVPAWLAGHHGVARGWTSSASASQQGQIDSLLDLGVLVPYARSRVPVGWGTRDRRAGQALACAVAPDVVVSFDSAARLWGLRRVGNDGLLHVTIAGRAHRSIPDTVVHRSHRVDSVDVVDRPDGIRVTSPPRTVFDLAARLSDERIDSIVEQVLHGDACTMPTLFATGSRLGERGRPGSARFARVLRSGPRAQAGRLRPGAPPGAGLVAAGLPAGRQAAVRLRGGQSSIPTSLAPQGEALEVDHVTWHGGKLDQYDDKRRDRQLRQVGIHVTRVTDDDIPERLRAVIADLGPSSPHPTRGFDVVDDVNSRQIAEGAQPTWEARPAQ